MSFLDFFIPNEDSQANGGIESKPFYKQDFSKKDLDYNECINIYKYWPLGKRIARSLPNFAMSAERKIIFEDYPVECINRFKEIEKQYNINNIVKRVATFARIFGLSGLYIAVEGKNPEDPLSYDDLQKGLISFNIQDPLNLNGIEIGQDPLALNYQKVSSIKINSQDVHISRCLVIFNDMNFYLKWTPSTFNYGSPSIYQNMVDLITSWQMCVTSLERMSNKAGAIVWKNRSGGVINSMVVEAAQSSLNMINSLRNTGIASVEKDSDLEFFNLTGVDAVDKIMNQMNQIILMALSDTPAAILLDKELAQGFGNGEEDMKAILMAVDDFRRSVLTPIYHFLDKYLLYLAFTPSFLEELKDTYSQDFKDISIEVMRENLFNSFRYEWGNLYPETEATRCDNMTKKLDNLQKLKDLGADLSDIEDIINNDKDLYQEEIRLSENNIESDTDDDFGDSRSSIPENPETREDINSDNK